MGKHGVRKNIVTMGLVMALTTVGLLGTVELPASAAGPLTILNVSPQYAGIWETYSHPTVLSGGTAPFSYSIVDGTLPSGLSLQSDGTISGLPDGPSGTSTYTEQVTDSGVPPQTVTQVQSIQVGAGQSLLVPGSTLQAVLGVVKATLTGGIPGQPLAGISIEFDLGSGDVPICTAITNAAGVASCRVNLTTTGLKILTKNGFNAWWPGNDRFIPSSGYSYLLPPAPGFF